MKFPRLMRNKWTNVVIVSIVVGAALLAYSKKSHGEEILFSAGVPGLRGVTPAVDISWRFPSQTTDAFWQTSLTLVGESTFKGEYQPNNAALQVLYVDGFGGFDIGLGAAFLQNTDAYNGSTANFALQIGYNWKHAYLQYRHWSNAGTQKPNLGRDLLFLGWRF